jgi:hypothetical protein
LRVKEEAMKKEKKEKVKLNLDELEIESFETKVAPVVVGGGSDMATHSCAHSSCSRGGPC